MKIMTIRAPDTLREEMGVMARQMGLTRNALILQILWEWVNSQSKDVPTERS